MNARKAIDEWWDRQIQASRGARRKRLEDEGLTYATKLYLQNVWWPLFHHFDHLHAEFEVNDFKDGARFVDLAYIRPWFSIAVEMDGYGPHARDCSPEKFGDERDRQNDLVIDGWKVLRFAVSRIKSQPRACQIRTGLLVSRGLDEERLISSLTLQEREIVRMARRMGGMFRLKEVRQWLGVNQDTARKLARQMMAKGIVVGDQNPERIHVYQLAVDANRYRMLD